MVIGLFAEKKGGEGMDGVLWFIFALMILNLIACIREATLFIKKSPKLSLGRLWMYVIISWTLSITASFLKLLFY